MNEGTEGSKRLGMFARFATWGNAGGWPSYGADGQYAVQITSVRPALPAYGLAK
jgi:hypothetical protein